MKEVWEGSGKKRTGNALVGREMGTLGKEEGWDGSRQKRDGKTVHNKTGMEKEWVEERWQDGRWSGNRFGGIGNNTVDGGELRRWVG